MTKRATLDSRIERDDGPPLLVTDQRVSIGNVRAVTESTVTAEVRLTITCENGRTYSVYRRLRLAREKRPVPG